MSKEVKTILYVVGGIALFGIVIYFVMASTKPATVQAQSPTGTPGGTNPTQNSFALPKGFAIADWALNFGSNLWGSISGYIPALNNTVPTGGSQPNTGAPGTTTDTTASV